LSIPLGLLEFFSKICGNVHSSRFTTGAVDTGGKFTAGVVDTSNSQILGLNSQSKICQFLRYASSKILNPQISFD
jgi:hypothetical protein